MFEVIDGLRRHGVAVVYISHFLEEVQRVADRFLVLRDGRVAGAGATADVSLADLVELMIGRRLPDLFPTKARQPGEPLLELHALIGEAQPTGVDLCLRRGEVLGLAGLVGAGRTELLRAIFGLDPIVRGRVTIAGYSARAHSPADRLAQGVGLLSEDRQAEGLALSRSIAHNMLLSRLEPFSRWGWLNRRLMRETVRTWIARLGIRAEHPDQTVSHLSGGNQQKVAFARLLHHDVDVFLLDEPTRGVDVASKAQLYAWIEQLVERGKAILFVSDYVPELLGVCDRVAVMYRGRLGGARPANAWTERDVMTAATSGEGDVV